MHSPVERHEVGSTPTDATIRGRLTELALYWPAKPRSRARAERFESAAFRHPPTEDAVGKTREDSFERAIPTQLCDSASRTLAKKDVGGAFACHGLRALIAQGAHVNAAKQMLP